MSFFVLKSKKVSNAEKISDKTIKDMGIAEEQIRDLISLKINDFFPLNQMMVVTTEFSSWADSSRRLDILAFDKKMNLVVLELKRDDKAPHADLQAIRYAAMLSVCTAESIIAAGLNYRRRNDPELSREQFEKEIRTFLGLQNLSTELQFSKIPKIILVSSGFSKEITTTIMWLNEHFGSRVDGEIGMDISCYEIRVYEIGNDYALYFDQIIPIAESQDYLIRAREKDAEGEKQVIARRRQRTWVILQEKGLLAKNSQVYFKIVPSNISSKIEEKHKLATYLGEGRFIWNFNQKEYQSLNALVAALYLEFGEVMGSISMMECWARQGTNQSLSEEAENFYSTTC